MRIKKSLMQKKQEEEAAKDKDDEGVHESKTELLEKAKNMSSQRQKSAVKEVMKMGLGEEPALERAYRFGFIDGAA